MKKLITLVLSAAMLLSLLCVTAFAEGPENCPDVENCMHVAEITAGVTTTHYDTLADAVAAVPADGTQTTITLLRDAVGSGVKVQKDQNIIFDLATHTYQVTDTVGSSGTETNGFQLLMGSTVTFKNGTLTSETAKILIQNYCDLTLDNVTVDGTNLAGNYPYAMSNNNGNVLIKDSVIKAADDGVAFDVYSFYPYTGANVTVENSVVDGKIEVGASNGANTGTLGLSIESGTFTGTLDVTAGLAEKVDITGGTFSEDVSDYIKDAEVAEVLIDGTFYVGDAATAAIEELRTGDKVEVVAGSVEIGGRTYGPNDIYTKHHLSSDTPNTNNTNSGTTITQSPKTADAGIAVYGVMSVMSLLGMGYVSKKKSR